MSSRISWISWKGLHIDTILEKEANPCQRTPPILVKADFFTRYGPSLLHLNDDCWKKTKTWGNPKGNKTTWEAKNNLLNSRFLCFYVFVFVCVCVQMLATFLFAALITFQNKVSWTAMPRKAPDQVIKTALWRALQWKIMALLQFGNLQLLNQLVASTST